MIDQSIATMTFSELESLISQLIEQKVNQVQSSNRNAIEQSQLVDNINSLQESFKKKYGDFPDSTELLQQDRAQYCNPE